MTYHPEFTIAVEKMFAAHRALKQAKLALEQTPEYNKVIDCEEELDDLKDQVTILKQRRFEEIKATIPAYLSENGWEIRSNHSVGSSGHECCTSNNGDSYQWVLVPKKLPKFTHIFEWKNHIEFTWYVEDNIEEKLKDDIECLGDMLEWCETSEESMLKGLTSSFMSGHLQKYIDEKHWFVTRLNNIYP